MLRTLRMEKNKPFSLYQSGKLHIQFAGFFLFEVTKSSARF